MKFILLFASFLLFSTPTFASGEFFSADWWTDEWWEQEEPVKEPEPVQEKRPQQKSIEGILKKLENLEQMIEQRQQRIAPKEFQQRKK